MLAEDQDQVRSDSSRYAKCIAVSKRIRWDIERDVIRERTFDFSKRFLPDGLTRAAALEFLSDDEQRLFSQVQGRTYANMFGLVERFIGAKMLEISRRHWFGDQVALEALVRFTDEELKHQALFRRIETMMASGMAPGYEFVPDANEVAGAVMAASTWSVLALTCHIELFTQAHYRQSIEPNVEISDIFKDVFLFHWMEESQHAIIDELEWRSEDSRLTPEQRDLAVTDLIHLIGAVDGIVHAQAAADANYFLRNVGRGLFAEQVALVRAELLRAYRWQYIVSGVEEPRFSAALTSMVTDAQAKRIQSELVALTA